MSTGYTIPIPRFRAFDANGVPLVGGKLYAYAAGTSTPLDTYADQALTTPNSNPVILDGNGEATIYVPDGTEYKFILQDADSVQQWSVDNVAVPAPITPSTPSPVPTGGMIPYGGSSAPTGFLLCDGSAVSRATYADLFAVIGTTYGAGDGTTTFGVPDMRQRFPLGKAASGTGATLGSTGGAIDHTHTGPSHTHSVTVTRDGWGSSLNTPGVTGRLQTGNAGGSGPDTSEYLATTDLTVTSAAGGTGDSGTANPPYLALNFIIKT